MNHTFFTAQPSFLKYSLNSPKSINAGLGSITNLSDLSDCALVKILLFRDQNYTQVENSCIINATIGQCYQWSTSVAEHELNDFNIFVITCFFLVFVERYSL